MLRRRAVSILLGGLSDINASESRTLGHLLSPDQGIAVLLNVASRRIVAINGISAQTGKAYPPGSTLKPFILASLLKRGWLRPDSSWACPGRLSIGKRQFDCVHPPMVTPMRIDTALAYSCNCFVAHIVEQSGGNEIYSDLLTFGFGTRTGLAGSGEASGRIERPITPDAARLLSLGEGTILVTPLVIAAAYRQLALQLGSPTMLPILAGLEDAVAFGTAQRAHVPGVTVAGKTGSTRSAAGDSLAWFAGFMPSRAPEVVVVVMLSGRSGGSDAAPIAAQILNAYRARRL
jgi:cell division protein FtsI/penicillin-binding protein 2